MSNVLADWSLIPGASLSFLSLWVPLADQPYAREAHIEFGEEVASRLKLSSDGKIVLWPQPSDEPEDPQNVCPCPKGVTDYSLIDLITFSGLNGRRPFNW
jgi:hypothetical protein